MDPIKKVINNFDKLHGANDALQTAIVFAQGHRDITEENAEIINHLYKMWSLIDFTLSEFQTDILKLWKKDRGVDL